VIEFVSALLVMQLASDSISQLPLKRLTDGRLSPMLTPQAFACRHLNLFFRTNWFFLRALAVLIPCFYRRGFCPTVAPPALRHDDRRPCDTLVRDDDCKPLGRPTASATTSYVVALLLGFRNLSPTIEAEFFASTGRRVIHQETHPRGCSLDKAICAA
jgi:hypothetical protein